MDTFFRRHFKGKETGGLRANEGTTFSRYRRPSMAVPTSKARRRSGVGLPSSSLAQRRHSSVQLQGGNPFAGGCCTGGGRLAKSANNSKLSGHVRRRSSTTTPSLNPRFTVHRRRAGKLRTIHTHLLGPSMLLASLIQMTEEEEGGLVAGEKQVEVRGSTNHSRILSRSSTLHSDRDDDSDYFTPNDSQSDNSPPLEVEQLAEADASDQEIENISWWLKQNNTAAATTSCSPPPSSLGVAVTKSIPPPSLMSRPLIRAPRCLRRNSSRLLPGDLALLYGHDCRTSQRKRRRISTISKAGSPWPGRGVPLPNRRSSAYYLNHPVVCRSPGSLSPSNLGPHYHQYYYDPRLESWSGFLLYVVHDLSSTTTTTTAAAKFMSPLN